MIRLLLTKLPTWAAVLLLAIVAILVMPSLTFAASTTDVINLFKYTYGLDRLTYIAAQEIVLWRILSKKKTPVGGRGQWIIPIQTANAGVFVGNTEGGAKTTRRAQPTTAEATFFLQEFHGIWDVSWKMLQDAKKDEYAFERAIDFLDESFRRRTFRLLNADLCGTGRGELASISSSQDGTVTPTVSSLPFADQGMLVDMISAADDLSTVGIAGRSVSQVDVVNRQMTLSAGTNILGSAAKDYFTVADSIAGLSRSNHTFGIRAWLDTANPKTILTATPGFAAGGTALLGGIDRSVAGNIYWQSNLFSNAGVNRPLTEDLLLQSMDVVRERGGRTISDWMSDLALLRRYHESLKADVFFALNSVQALGSKVGIGRSQKDMEGGENSEGETPYEFSNIPWRAEMFFAPNQLIGFNREHFMIGHGDNEVPRPISEVFGEDMVPFFTGTNNTTFEVVSYGQFQLLSDNPASGVKITDIAEA